MTSKSLPRDPTPEMVWAARCAVPSSLNNPEAEVFLRAAWDAASSLPLKRTEPPSEPGWYWGRSNRSQDNPQVEPLIVLPSRIHGCLVTGTYHLGACMLHEFEWFGPLGPIPEVEP